MANIAIHVGSPIRHRLRIEPVDVGECSAVLRGGSAPPGPADSARLRGVELSVSDRAKCPEAGARVLAVTATLLVRRCC
jgi:hypothetical protein